MKISAINFGGHFYPGNSWKRRFSSLHSFEVYSLSNSYLDLHEFYQKIDCNKHRFHVKCNKKTSQNFLINNFLIFSLNLGRNTKNMFFQSLLRMFCQIQWIQNFHLWESKENNFDHWFQNNHLRSKTIMNIR